MAVRYCPRCHATLHREEEGGLVYCWSCGAPQVQLSEELRDQLEEQIGAQQAAVGLSSSPQSQSLRSRQAVAWRGALQAAAMAGGIAAGLSLLSFVLAPVSLLSLAWFLSAPIVVLGIYSSRFRQTPITAALGARLGALSALAIFFATATLNTIALVLERFVLHSNVAIADIDSQLNKMFDQLRTNFAAQSQQSAKLITDLLAVPEYRAGLLLASIFFCLLLYLAYAAAAGAFAGYLRSRSPRP
ncbi:MAG: hypothetical protein ACP5E5_05840 [Acidobacteriaceae bacterium]